ncbi:contractile injection system protein, VgrG/Pvc8 family [Paenibacillus durus]|uniref:Uncharacterized protein n=1 Tax=Paenibacillus durus ATCC 35681 TaxID=1333534 RepID=A0A0F7FCI3_PAEDU|nr:contractile injection system protein, VgrG/Pvc8 family [Paenibacillus durus]AKG36439.1 hypothetical protein VK70_19380 [Paenibacillus durus ATCC 35681]
MSTFELTLASQEIKLVWPYELETVTSFQVIRQLNEHARIRFTAVISDAYPEKYIETVNSQDSIQAFQISGSRDTPIFSGIVSNITIHVVRDTYVAEVEGISHTFDLDIRRSSRSYQNRSSTYDHIIRQVIAPYPGSDYIDMAHGSQTVGEFLMQYEETDWQFIQRLASHTGAVLVPDVTLPRPAFWFGIPELDPVMELDATSYRTSRNRHMDKIYEVESKQLLPLGQLVRFNDQQMVVAGSVIELDKGIVRKHYTLTSPTGRHQPKRYNSLLTGLSLDGRVIAVHRKMVQIHLDIDAEEPPESTSWFPYSGEGNNAWYSMPKAGGRVQLYFPDPNENHAFATSSTRGSGETMQSHPKMSNPNVKSFVNDSGKTMELAERNISFTTGPVSIIMDEQGVKLDSPAKIVVKPSEELSLGLPLPDTESAPTPLITVKAGKSLSFMQAGFTGLEIEDLHKMLSNKTYIEGTSTETVAYPLIVSEGQHQAQQAAQKLEQYKLSEERKSKGALNMIGGLMNTIVGAVTVAAGVAAVGVGVALGWTGVGLVLAGAGAVAIAAGAYTAASGVADIAEGAQDYYYGSKGDTKSHASNFVRDTLFKGNEEAYRMSVDIAMITGGLAAEFVAPYLVLSSVLGTGRMMNRMNSSQKPQTSQRGGASVSSGGTGQDKRFTGAGMKDYDKVAEAEYESIRNLKMNDIEDVARNTGLSVDEIRTMKKHLFFGKHEIPQPGGLEFKLERFAPDDEIAFAWKTAQKRDLSAEQKEWFKQLAEHELTERKLMAEGQKYRTRESWNGEKGTFDGYPPGAHENAPSQPNTSFPGYEEYYFKNMFK